MPPAGFAIGRVRLGLARKDKKPIGLAYEKVTTGNQDDTVIGYSLARPEAWQALNSPFSISDFPFPHFPFTPAVAPQLRLSDLSWRITSNHASGVASE